MSSPYDMEYPVAVSWMRKLLYQTKMTGERVKVVATKMENSVAEVKRRASRVVSILMNNILMSEDSNYHSANMIRQQQFLKNLLKKLECSPKVQGVKNHR